MKRQDLMIGACVTALALAALIVDGRAARVIREGRRVVITGRPNAGKSSLFTALDEAGAALLDRELHDRLALELQPDDAATRQMLQNEVRKVLDELNDREKEVVIMRFGLDDEQPRTLEEVGKQFGVTRERIRQIESKTLAKLRHPHRSQKLREYLEGA